MAPHEDRHDSVVADVLGKIAVVVVNYGSHALLAENLVSVAAAAPEAMVVVVDNYSGRSELQDVRALCTRHDWTLVALAENGGFGAGVNAGANTAIAAGRDILLVLNPDATISRDDMERLTSAVAEDPAVMVAPVIRRPDGTVWQNGSDLYLSDGHMGNPRRRGEHAGGFREWLSGACFAVATGLWQRAGGFDDDYFLYWEDVDLSYRIVEAGGRLETDQEAQAIHDEGGTHTDRRRGRAKSETYYYYNIRNRLVYGAKHATDDELRRWKKSTLRVSYGILLQGGRRQFLHSPAPLRALLRGVRDGRRYVRRMRGI